MKHDCPQFYSHSVHLNEEDLEIDTLSNEGHDEQSFQVETWWPAISYNFNNDKPHYQLSFTTLPLCQTKILAIHNSRYQN